MFCSDGMLFFCVSSVLRDRISSRRRLIVFSFSEIGFSKVLGSSVCAMIFGADSIGTVLDSVAGGLGVFSINGNDLLKSSNKIIYHNDQLLSNLAIRNFSIGLNYIFAKNNNYTTFEILQTYNGHHSSL